MEHDDKKLMVVEEPFSGAGRFIPAMVVMGALVGFVALAWYAYHVGAQSSREDDLLVVEADKTPIKEKPADPGGMQFPNQDKTIFETFSNKGEQPPKVERVLPTPEEPLPAATDNADTSSWVNDKLQAKKSEQVIGKAEPEEKAPETPAEPVVPTIHKAEDEPAPVAQTPDADKKTETIPSVFTNSPAPSVAEEKHASNDAPAETYVAPAIKPEAKAAEPAAVAAPVEEKPAAPAEPKVETKAEAKPAPETPAKTEAKTGTYKVQLGAYGSEKEARAAWAKIQKKHAELAALSPAIVEADLEKGIFYRLRATGINSAADAKTLCSALTAAGQACIIPMDK